MNLRILLGLGVAAAALAIPASAAPICAGQPDTGGVCADAYMYGWSVGYHFDETCVTTGSGCTYVPYPVIDYVRVGDAPTVEVTCYGALDRALNCPS